MHNSPRQWLKLIWAAIVIKSEELKKSEARRCPSLHLVVEIGNEKIAFFSSFPVNEIHSSLKEEKPNQVRIQFDVSFVCT